VLVLILDVYYWIWWWTYCFYGSTWTSFISGRFCLQSASRSCERVRQRVHVYNGCLAWHNV